MAFVNLNVLNYNTQEIQIMYVCLIVAQGYGVIMIQINVLILLLIAHLVLMVIIKLTCVYCLRIALM